MKQQFASGVRLTFALAIAALVSASASAQTAAAPSPAAPRFSSFGVQLPGSQIYSDAGFDFLDWNGDGKLDLFVLEPSMTSDDVYLNEGSLAQPKFKFGMWYPVNFTESEPYGMYFVQTHCLCDLNHDGMFDMLVFDGQLRMVYNTGTTNGPNHWNLAKPAPYFPGSAQMIKENSRLTLTPETMYWSEGVFPRQVLTMTVADWDGDGLEDLIICRFKDQAPGVVPVDRVTNSMASLPDCRLEGTTWNEKLAQTPARGVYFYKNTGTREKPYFDAGIEITTADGQSIAAPNPVVMDVDGDGTPDLVSTETHYACNAYRVDWPTNPSVIWFKRPNQADVAHVTTAQPVLDAARKSIPAGVNARVADIRGVGVKDLFVMDPVKGLRWYQNTAKRPTDRPVYAAPTVIQGTDFARFDFMYQPLVVNWFGPNSRDLILHGCNDAHCQLAYRRTALYRNVAKRPGELKYEFVGHFKYLDDPSMVPQKFPFEERGGDIYGSFVALMPDDGTGQKRLVMSVAGKLYLFNKLAADGLTFQERKPISIPNPVTNYPRGWQEIPLRAADKVQFIRLSAQDVNSPLDIVSLEAIAGGKNYATTNNVAEIKQPRGIPFNPSAMLTPGNQPSETRANFTSLHGLAIISLKEPVALEKIRFLLSDRPAGWYNDFWPFTFQGKTPRHYSVAGAASYKYKVETSMDQTNWTVVADRMRGEMTRTCPVFVDWNRDGKFDLVLGVVNSTASGPHDKEYRLYLNQGTNDDPKFDDYLPFGDETGKPISLYAHWAKSYSPQCGVALLDRNGDGKIFDLVIEDAEPQGGLRFYQNVAADPARELRFKYVNLLGEPMPINYPSGYRFFYCGDVDGDGVPDVINCASAGMGFFKGIPAGAPRVTADLAVTGSDQNGVELRWTRPPGAVKYDLRASDQPAITATDWADLPSVMGDYSVAEGSNQTARLPLPAGKETTIALRSIGPKGEPSAISSVATAATLPLKRIVLRNGPEGLPGVPVYNGTQACYLDASKPAQPTPRHPSQLEVRTLVPFPVQKQKLILIRFADLPKLAALDHATLELTTDPQFETRYQSLPPTTEAETSCSIIRDDWDPATATYAEAAPGKPWAANELDAGGKFLCKTPPQYTFLPRRTVAWDVTAAVREAQQAGRNSISLLIREEYTGKYAAGVGFIFCGPNWPAVQYRPRLCLVTKE